jgi:hypothetical protein
MLGNIRLPGSFHARIVSDFTGSTTDPVVSVGDPPTERCAADNLTRSAAFPAYR